MFCVKFKNFGAGIFAGKPEMNAGVNATEKGLVEILLPISCTDKSRLHFAVLLPVGIESIDLAKHDAEDSL